jgi:hypothetical protein
MVGDGGPFSIFEGCKQLSRARVGVAEHELAPDLLCARLARLGSAWRCLRTRRTDLVGALNCRHGLVSWYPRPPSIHGRTVGAVRRCGERGRPSLAETKERPWTSSCSCSLAVTSITSPATACSPQRTSASSTAPLAGPAVNQPSAARRRLGMES